MIHFGGPPLTIHVGYCGAPGELSGNLNGEHSDQGPPVDCPDCIGKAAKLDRRIASYEEVPE